MMFVFSDKNFSFWRIFCIGNIVQIWISANSKCSRIRSDREVMSSRMNVHSSNNLSVMNDRQFQERSDFVTRILNDEKNRFSSQDCLSLQRFHFETNRSDFFSEKLQKNSKKQLKLFFFIDFLFISPKKNELRFWFFYFGPRIGFRCIAEILFVLKTGWVV